MKARSSNIATVMIIGPALAVAAAAVIVAVATGGDDSDSLDDEVAREVISSGSETTGNFVEGQKRNQCRYAASRCPTR